MLSYRGQQLGSYRLIKMLGRGRLADVYLGEHPDLTTQVAIKVLTAPLTDQEVVKFRNLAPAIITLEHRNILRVYDVGIEDHKGYIVMDYAPNGSTRAHYPTGVSLHPYTAISYVEQIAAALHYAHSRRASHWDIRPANILLGSSGEVLVGDFGIAPLYQDMHYQHAQTVVGDALYMAPEQFRGEPCAASDQYALGVVVYQWLCGDCPFHGSFAESGNQHVFVPPPSLGEKNPAIPLAVQGVVLKALAKDPAQRFASISDFAKALEMACISELPLGSNPAYRLPDSPALPVRHPSTEPLPPASLIQQSASAPARVIPNTPLPGPKNTRSGPRLSRRAMLAGLTGLVVVGGGIGVGWLTLFRKSSMGTIISTYHGHGDIVYDAAWSPDGKRIGSASNDLTVQVWDATTGKNALIYGGHSSGVRAAVWSPDGKLIASCGYDHTAQVWNAASMSPLLTYRGHPNAVWQVAWSPNGQHIASAGQDGTVQIWDATTGSQVLTYHGHGSSTVRAVVWSPDGKRIASGGYDRTVQVWDTTTGNPIFTYSGHQDWVASVAWSPDGKLIVSGGYDHTAQVWDATTGKHVYTYLGHAMNAKTTIPNVNAVAWSPDSQRIASASGDKTVQIWDATSGANAFTYHGHSGWVYTAAWSPDGQLIASGGTDKIVQVWQTG